MNQQAPPAAFDADKRTEQYVKLRDYIRDTEARQKEELAQAKEMLRQLEALMLAHLDATNSNSINTKAGTFYRSSRKSASIKDGEAFMRYVIDNQAWDLLDRKANATAVADFIDAHNAPPPGVNFTTMVTLGVQKK